MCVFLRSIECSWKGESCQLKVHYEDGFKLTELPKSDGDKPRVLWQSNYTQLRTSADDGNRLLWLDFGAEDGEKVQQHYVKTFLSLYQLYYVYLSIIYMQTTQPDLSLSSEISFHFVIICMHSYYY